MTNIHCYTNLHVKITKYNSTKIKEPNILRTMGRP